MTKIAIARNSIPLSVLSNRGRSVCPNSKPRIDAVRDEDGLGALDTEKLVFAVFRCRASSDEVHLRLAEPTKHPSFRCEIRHRDWWKLEVSFRPAPVAFQLAFRRRLLVIGLPNAIVFPTARTAITRLASKVIGYLPASRTLSHSSLLSKNIPVNGERGTNLMVS